MPAPHSSCRHTVLYTTQLLLCDSEDSPQYPDGEQRTLARQRNVPVMSFARFISLYFTSYQHQFGGSAPSADWVAVNPAWQQPHRIGRYARFPMRHTTPPHDYGGVFAAEFASLFSRTPPRTP